MNNYTPFLLDSVSKEVDSRQSSSSENNSEPNYIIVEGKYLKPFTDKCNELINKGYEPLGTIVISVDSYGTPMNKTQVFVKPHKNLGILKEKFSAIPLQLCPKCGGTGEILAYPTYNELQKGTKEKYVRCDICKGEKLIPMYINK